MSEDDDGTCYFVGGPVDGKTYVFPRRTPVMYFPVFENYWTHEEDWATRWEPAMNIPKKAIYNHIIGEIYWYAGTR